MSLFDEVAALMRTGQVWIIDTTTGAYQHFTAEGYAVVSGLLAIDRFKVRLSLPATLELVNEIELKNAGRN